MRGDAEGFRERYESRVDEQIRKAIELRDGAAVRRVVAELDRRIVDFLRFPSGPRVPIRRPSADEVVARWRAASAAARPVPPPPRPAPPPPRRSWWRRLREG